MFLTETYPEKAFRVYYVERKLGGGGEDSIERERKRKKNGVNEEEVPGKEAELQMKRNKRLKELRTKMKGVIEEEDEWWMLRRS